MPNWLAVLLLAAAPCGAQVITGTVYDPTGGVVPDARIMLMRDYVKLQETMSSETGAFSFAGLKPGMYQVQIKLPRFSLFQQTVVLKANEDTRVYAVLRPLRVSETFGVTAPRPPGGNKQYAPGMAVRIGGRVDPPRLLKPPRPPYPAGASSRGAEGPVVMYFTIKADGSVSNVLVLQSPDRELAESAAEAAAKLRYEPLKINGQAFDCDATAVLNYRLE